MSSVPPIATTAASAETQATSPPFGPSSTASNMTFVQASSATLRFRSPIGVWMLVASIFFLLAIGL